MKRNAKIIALAAALALCLLMTGCYVPPDDVNNGGETNTGGNLPFQTLQPTATVTMTPDTVVVETPQTTQGQQGQNICSTYTSPVVAVARHQAKTERRTTTLMVSAPSSSWSIPTTSVSSAAAVATGPSSCPLRCSCSATNGPRHDRRRYVPLGI